MNPRFFLCVSTLLCVLLMASCSDASSTNPVSSTPALPTATHTPIPTARPTATPKSISTPTTAPDPLRPVSYAVLGQGLTPETLRSPDGSLIAVLEADTLRWLDTASGEELGFVRQKTIRDLLDFSPDNQWILMDAENGIFLVNTTTKVASNITANTSLMGSYHFSTDSRFVITQMFESPRADNYGVLRVYDLTRQQWSDEYPYAYDNAYYRVTPPVISPDGRWLAAGCYRDYYDDSQFHLYIWNVQTSELHLDLLHTAEVNSLAFSPDGRYLASGSEDGLLRLFDPLTGDLLRTVSGFLSSINNIRFSADSSQIFVSFQHEYDAYKPDKPDQVYHLNTERIETFVAPELTPDSYRATLHQQGYSDGCEVLFSPGGRSLAVGDQSVQLWDLSNQRITASLENPYGRLLHSTFSPDGRQFAGVTQTGAVLVWNTTSGELVFRLSGKVDPSSGIAFSPDGNRVAFKALDAIEIWNIAHPSLVQRLPQPVPNAEIYRLRFSDDGQSVQAVILEEQTLQIWNASTSQLTRHLDFPPEDITYYTDTALTDTYFARTNDYNDGNTIEVWNLEGEKLTQIPVPESIFTPIYFSPDGQFLFRVMNNSLFFWETETGQLVHQMDLPSNPTISTLTISPDGNTLATCNDGRATLWDISALHQAVVTGTFPPLSLAPTATPEASNPPAPLLGVESIVFSAIPTQSEGAITPANAIQLQEIAHFGSGILTDAIWSNAPGAVRFLTLGSQGVLAFSGPPYQESIHLPTEAWFEAFAQRANGDILAADLHGSNVQVWNLTTNQLLADLPGSRPIQINRDGSLLIYGYSNDTLLTNNRTESGLCIYDLIQGSPIATLPGSYMHLPVFSPNNRLIAATYDSHPASSVRVWDIQTGKIVNVLGGPDTGITDLSFSPDGQFLVGAAGGSAWIWEVMNPNMADAYRLKLFTSEQDVEKLHYIQSVTAAQISPDNRLLALADNLRNLWLYDLASGTAVYRLQGHAAPIELLRFNPDGSLLLSADTDGAILLWDVSTGDAVDKLTARTGSIRGLTALPDGRLRAWGANTVWDLSSEDGTLVHSTTIPAGTIDAASPAADWLVVSHRLYLSVWDAATGEFVQMLAGQAGEPSTTWQFTRWVFKGFDTVNFSTDGARLTANAPGETWEYDFAAGPPFPIVDYQQTYVAYDIFESHYDLSIPSADGSLIARKADDNSNHMVLSNSLGDIYDLTISQTGATITALAFSPDARLLAIGLSDGSLQILNVARGQLITTLTGHRGSVSILAFSADSKALVSADAYGIVRIWRSGE